MDGLLCEVMAEPDFVPVGRRAGRCGAVLLVVPDSGTRRAGNS